MANNLTAIISADTSRFNKAVSQARLVLQQYSKEAQNASNSISKNTSVTSSQIASYQRVVKSLEKVGNGTMSTAQQQKTLIKQIQELKIQWANLSDTAKNGDFGKSISNSIKTAESQLNQLNTQLKQTTTNLKATSNATQGMSFKGLQGLQTQIGNVSSAMGSLGMAGGSVLSSLSSTGGALANPYVAGTAAIAGATYALIDFNKTLDEQVSKTEKFLGITGDEAVAIRGAIKSIADTYGTDYDSALGAVDQLTKQFGIDAKTATDLISIGMAGGANEAGNMTSMISQFSGVFADAGISAENFIGIMAQTQSGIFSEQGLSIIAKAQAKLTEMSSSTASKLQSIGIDATAMGEKLKNGTMSGWDAIKEVSQALKNLSPETQEFATVVKDVFGKVGVQAGSEMIKMLSDMDVSIQGVINNMTDEERATYDLQKADEDLENALASLFGCSESGFGTMYTTIKTKVYTAIATLINGCIDLYNKSTLIRGGVAAIALQFKQAWAVIKGVCRQLAISIEGIADVMEDVINLDFDKVGADVQKTIKATSKNFGDLGNELIKNIGDAFKQIQKGKITHIKVTADVSDVKLKHIKQNVINTGGTSNNSNSNSTTTTITPELDQNSIKGIQSQINEITTKLETTADIPESEIKELQEKKKDLENKLNAEKIRLGIIVDPDKKQLEDAVDKAEKDIDKTIEKLGEKPIETPYKIVNKTDYSSLSVEQQFDANNASIEKNNQEMVKLHETVNSLNNDYNSLDALYKKLYGGDSSKWSDDAKNRLTKLQDEINNTTDKYNKLDDKQKELINTNNNLNKSIGKLELEKASKEGYEGFKQTTNAVFSLGDSLSNIVENWDDMNPYEKIKAFTNVIFDSIDSIMKMQQGLQQLANMFNVMSSASSAAQAVENTNTQQSVANATTEIAANSGKAISGATASGAKMSFPLNIVAIAMGVAAVVAALSTITGSFADGGIIGGSTTIGDYNLAKVNKGEMILNGTQQKRLFNILDGTGVNGNSINTGGEVNFKIKGKDLVGVFSNYDKKTNKIL